MNDEIDSIRLNQSEAERFLNGLDPKASSFTFQTFPEKGKSGSGGVVDGELSNVWLALEFANIHHHGVGVTINETQGGRKGENATRIRAVWQEDDNGYPDGFPLEPSVEVQSSAGKFHRYWLVDGDWPADEQGRADFAAVMATMVGTYGSDPSAKDISRAMRLPGTLHQKGEPQLVTIICPAGSEPVRYTRQQIVSSFVQHPVVVSSGPPPIMTPKVADDIDQDRVKSALSAIPSDARDTWLKVGMALHREIGGDDVGFQIWDDWAKTTAAGNYDLAKQRRAWKSFRDHPTPVTFASVFQLAIDHGWERQETNTLRFDLRGDSRGTDQHPASPRRSC
ncbi:PriCT-2 domain-containing protein [Devosia sp. A449]